MKMKKMICAAFCGLAVLTMAGCGELKPDQVNGVYKNDNNTYVFVYDTEIELANKEKAMQFKVYKTDPKSVYDNKQIYSKSEFLLDKDGNIYQPDLTGAKVMYGKFKDNTVNFNKELKANSIVVGEYKKSSDPTPSDEELSYDGWKVESDKMKNYLAKKKAEGPKPSAFEEHFKKQGWK